MPKSAGFSTLGDVIDAVRTLLAEPRAPGAPARVRRDYVLVSLLVPLGVIEALFLDDVIWRPLAVPMAVAIALTVLWRRTHALLAILFVAALQSGTDIVSYLVVDGTTLVNTTMLVGFVLTYALWRWGSGREVAVGMAAVVVANVASELADSSTPAIEGLVANIQWLFPSALGLAFRSRASLHLQRLDDARAAERHRLARELHDTVAHHVSAIAVQAQAGRAIAMSRPAAAAEIFDTVEQTASRTLDEMREMVSVLRDGSSEGNTAPHVGLDELGALAGTEGGILVDVELRGDLEGLSPAVETSLFRLAREAVTNARRHARHASRVSIRVEGGQDDVQLVVRDDGDPVAAVGRIIGYGLVGMAERVELLHGSFSAQPGPERGWVVTASLPRTTSAGRPGPGVETEPA